MNIQEILSRAEELRQHLLADQTITVAVFAATQERCREIAANHITNDSNSVGLIVQKLSFNRDVKPLRGQLRGRTRLLVVVDGDIYDQFIYSSERDMVERGLITAAQAFNCSPENLIVRV